MVFPLFFTYFAFLCFSEIRDETDFEIQDSFSFVTSRGRQYTLYTPEIEEEPKTGIFSFLSRQKSDEETSKKWYYVHINNKDIPKAQKHVHIEVTDQIIKDTFILYLSPRQIRKISSYSKLVEVDPSDKIDEVGPFNETNLLYVKTTPDYKLLPTSNLYTIEKRNSKDSYIVRVDQNDLDAISFLHKKKEAARQLSEIPAVKIVTTYKKPTKQNNIDIGYIQKSDQPIVRDPEYGLYKYERYLHNHGLTGEGELITIEDMPIDFRHPMFRDDQISIEFNTEMPNHRKFRYYHYEWDMESWIKNITDDNHGTHTAGTLAGKSIVKGMGSLYDGSAPDAKLNYVGIYGNVTAEELEQRMNRFGSRISSNSWGDTDIHVDSLNHEYGLLAQRNPQSLFMFSAGNNALYGNFTVGDPGGNKNLLSIGYSINPVFVSKQQYTLQSRDHPTFIISVYGEFVFTLIEHSDFLGSKKGDSHIIALDSRSCSCDDIIGSHFTVLYGESLEEIFDFLNTCRITESAGIVMCDNITAVEQLKASHDRVSVVYNTIIDKPNKFAKGVYSSMGPGSKGILKPDIMAPGSYIVSAMSIQTGNGSYTCEDVSTGCGLSIKSGTSMAVPNVAGAMAMASQYFKSGRWPADKVELDGTTMRALAINSAKHPFGSIKPDIVYGHGMVDMSTLLPLEGGFGLQISHQNEKRPSLTNNGHLAAKIEVKSNKVPLQITMSYLDVVLEASSPIPLTHELDLVVVSPAGKVFYGDHHENDTQHFSTNEKIIVNGTDLVVGTYTVHVYGYSFIDVQISKENERQEFSVVATGDIENKYIEFSESSESPCEKADPNRPGFCICEDDEIGPFCQAKIHHYDVSDGQMLNLTLQPMSLYRMMISSNLTLTSVDAYYENSRDIPTMWFDKECHMTLGEYNMNGRIGPRKPAHSNITLGLKEICVTVFAYSDKIYNYHFNFYGVDLPDGGDDTPIDGGDGDKADKKLEKILLVLVIVLCVIFVILVVVIIVIIIKKKKSNQEEYKYDSSGRFGTKDDLI